MPKIELSPTAKIELQTCLTGYLVGLYKTGGDQPPEFAVTSELLSRIRARTRAGRFDVSDEEWGILQGAGFSGQPVDAVAN